MQLPIGVFHLCGFIKASSSAKITEYIAGIALSSANTTNVIVSDSLDGLNTTKVQSNLNTIVKVSTNSTSYYLNLYLAYTGTITIDTSISGFTATRIA